MVELQDASTPERSQPLSAPVICETILSRRSGHIRGMGCGPKPSRLDRSGPLSSSWRDEIEIKNSKIFL